MYGSSNGAVQASAPSSVGAIGGITNSSAASRTGQLLGFSAAPAAIPWVLVGLVVLYLAWAIVQQHETVRAQVEPHNVALNFHNLWAVALPVIIFILLLKVFAAKWAAAGFWGADAISSIVGTI
jgi:hypothetical protein